MNRPVDIVAARSKAWVLAAWILRFWVRIPLKTWMFVLGVLCCGVLWGQRRGVGLIPVLGVLSNVELVDNFRCNSEFEQVTSPNVQKLMIMVTVMMNRS